MGMWSTHRKALVGFVCVGAALAGCTQGNAPTPGAGTSGSTLPSSAGSSPTTGSSPSGSVDHTEKPSGPSDPNPRESYRPDVKLTAPAKTGGVTVQVVKLRALTVKARQPGEVSGPGLAVTVQVRNGSDQTLRGGGLLVTIYGSDQAPGGEMSGPPTSPIETDIKPGGKATGTYAFTLPRAKRSPITIQVTLPSESPVLVFKGDAPAR